MNTISNPTKEQQKKANIIARKNGFNRATEIVKGDENKVVKYVQFGYRKYTTGEYVPNSYRSNFGWKNTYYQPAIVVVMISEN